VQQPFMRELLWNMLFQSSPVPEDGCNVGRVICACGNHRFQSSPVPEDGCNHPRKGMLVTELAVSILTRPGGRVQLAGPRRIWSPWEFQSSPVPEDGCNNTAAESRTSTVSRFNPHPSRRTGATRWLGAWI